MTEPVGRNVQKTREPERNNTYSLDDLRLGLEQIPGVLAVSFETVSGNIERVNIIAESGHKSPGQIVQDTISYLFVISGQRLKPDAVNVVRSSGGDLMRSERRPMLAELAAEYTEQGKTISVVLQLDEQEYPGTAVLVPGSETARDLMTAGIRATLKAADGVMRRQCEFRILDARHLSLAGEAVVIVAIGVFPELGSGVLVGTARVRRDVLDAAARATLDAINRAFTF